MTKYKSNPLKAIKYLTFFAFDVSSIEMKRVHGVDNMRYTNQAPFHYAKRCLFWKVVKDSYPESIISIFLLMRYVDE
jgi:hypothetical protein